MCAPGSGLAAPKWKSLAKARALRMQVRREVLPGAPVPVEPAPSGELSSPVRPNPAQVRTRFSSSLTAKQKYALAYRRIVSLQMPAKAILVSGFELAAHTGPDIPTNGWKPFGERVGYNALGISTTTFFNTAFVPALVHQDPRYFPLGGGPVKKRIRWAVRSEFVGVRDDGRAMPNYANLVGFALSSIVANAFTPRSSVGYEDTVNRYLIKIAVSTGLNVGREFRLSDHLKVLVRHSKMAEE